jgi:hypothetical protein
MHEAVNRPLVALVDQVRPHTPRLARRSPVPSHMASVPTTNGGVRVQAVRMGVAGFACLCRDSATGITGIVPMSERRIRVDAAPWDLNSFRSLLAGLDLDAASTLHAVVMSIDVEITAEQVR